jgi:hypothetical protein
VKVLLILLVFLYSCKTEQDVIDTREVWLTFHREDTTYRWVEQRRTPIIVYIYKDVHGTPHRVKTYEGLRMKILVASREGKQ